MVAAWISAETGVGPSMASGSQTWRGSWADFPTAPQKTQRRAADRAPAKMADWRIGMPAAPAAMSSKDEGAGDAPEHEDADHEPEVTDAVAKECLLRGIGSGVLLIPVTDEEVGTQSDQFPEDEGHDEIVGQHDAGHREHEERQAGEVARLRVVVLHVGQREDVNQQSDAGDDDHHAGG